MAAPKKKEPTPFEKADETFKQFFNPENQIGQLEDIAQHTAAMYNIGDNYWTENLEGKGKGKRRHSLKHLGDEDKMESHAKNMLRQWATYAYVKTGRSASAAEEEFSSDMRLKKFVDEHAQQTKLRNYEGVLHHMKNHRGFRKSLKEGELNALLETIISSLHPQQDKIRESIQELRRNKNYDPLLKRVNDSLKAGKYEYQLKSGISEDALRDLYSKLQNPGYRFNPDTDVDAEYSSFLVKPKKK